MIFAHGFGCNQVMWRLITPAFEKTHKIVLFDYVGHGESTAADYDLDKYGALDGFADDVIEICDAAGLHESIFVGHSVSATIGLKVAIRRPELFKKLILVCPSPCFINDGEYVGGFTRLNIDELLDFLDTNHLGWSSTMAPVIMSNDDHPELAGELTTSFCRTDPEVAKQFARVTFTADTRSDLPKVTVPSLILQCSNDMIAPRSVGEYVHRHLLNSELITLDASGHCPHLSAPERTIAAIKRYIADQ